MNYKITFHGTESSSPIFSQVKFITIPCSHEDIMVFSKAIPVFDKIRSGKDVTEDEASLVDAAEDKAWELMTDFWNKIHKAMNVWIGECNPENITWDYWEISAERYEVCYLLS